MSGGWVTHPGGAWQEIRTLTLTNFRSLAPDVVLELNRAEPRMQVLAGLNGSGKSNVLDAFRFIADALHKGLELALVERLGFGMVSRWSRGGPRDVRLVVEVEDLAGHDWKWGFTLTADADHEFVVKDESGAAWASQRAAGDPAATTADPRWEFSIRDGY